MSRYDTYGFVRFSVVRGLRTGRSQARYSVASLLTRTPFPTVLAQHSLNGQSRTPVPTSLLQREKGDHEVVDEVSRCNVYKFTRSLINNLPPSGREVAAKPTEGERVYCAFPLFLIIADRTLAGSLFRRFAPYEDADPYGACTTFAKRTVEDACPYKLARHPEQRHELAFGE